MPKTVTCFACKECLENYTTFRKAANCEKKHATQKIAEQSIEQAYKNKLAISDEVRLNSSSLCEIEINLIKWMEKHHNLRLSFKQGIESLTMGWISNSHNFPINGKTNWCGGEGGPNGYIGWNGEIRGTLKSLSGKQFEKYGIYDILSDRFGNNEEATLRGINLGSGGGYNESFTYNCKIFVDDFPILKEKASLVITQWKLRKNYNNEVKRLDESYQCGVKDLCKINPDHMIAANRLDKVVYEQKLLADEREKLINKLANIKENIKKQVLAENENILQPDPNKFKFQSKLFDELTYDLNCNYNVDSALSEIISKL